MKEDVKYITSHRARVLKAKEQLKTWHEKVSIFDREAFVEFYLFEDIIKFYEFKLKEEQEKQTSSDALKIEIYNEIVEIFKEIRELAIEQITQENYKAVWSSMPEHALMVAVKKQKYSKELLELAMEIVNKLSKK